MGININAAITIFKKTEPNSECLIHDLFVDDMPADKAHIPGQSNASIMRDFLTRYNQEFKMIEKMDKVMDLFVRLEVIQG